MCVCVCVSLSICVYVCVCDVCACACVCARCRLHLRRSSLVFFPPLRFSSLCDVPVFLFILSLSPSLPLSLSRCVFSSIPGAREWWWQGTTTTRKMGLCDVCDVRVYACIGVFACLLSPCVCMRGSSCVPFLSLSTSLPECALVGVSARVRWLPVFFSFPNCFFLASTSPILSVCLPVYTSLFSCACALLFARGVFRRRSEHTQ